MKVICIGGLPGSGKTFLGKSFLGDSGCPFLDDMTADQMPELREILSTGKSVVVSDPRFCLPYVREKAKRVIHEACPDAEIRWILFENNPAACRKNVARRSDGRLVDMHITNLSKFYDSTGVDEIIPVWSGDWGL